MGLFHKEQLITSGLFHGMTDFHSHVLPGVDDGIPTMAQALEALKFLESLGIKTLWMTPHIMEDYPNTTSELKKIFENLKKEFKGSLELHLSAENMLDGLFVERLAAKDVLPIGENHDMLLVETSFLYPPAEFDDILRSIKSAGYIPLLAHPERYDYMKEEEYCKLVESGIRFQVNLTSISGGYGQMAMRKAKWFEKKGMAYCYGTDIHRLKSFDEKIRMKY